jgi:hypothetical protein
VPKYRYEPTGMLQFIEGDYLRKVGKRTDLEIREAEQLHQHYWIVTVAYRPTELPLGDGHILDRDNIAFPPVVGCFICEAPWSEAENNRRCPGDPTK